MLNFVLMCTLLLASLFILIVNDARVDFEIFFRNLDPN